MTPDVNGAGVLTGRGLDKAVAEADTGAAVTSVLTARDQQ
jgi:hypothetical protein